MKYYLVVLVISYFSLIQSCEEYCIERLKACVQVPDTFIYALQSMIHKDPKHNNVTHEMNAKKIPLFVYHPGLQEKLSYLSLGDFPTPIEQLKTFSAELGTDNLYVKRDDLSGKQYENGGRLFGGNKLRKLEFLLADAIKHKAKTILTFGSAGSNHAVVTVAYAHQLGLKSIAMLKPQPNARNVRRNLLMMHHCGAELHLYPNDNVRSLGALYAFFRNKQQYDNFPYVIPTGGSCPIGIIGFVNAAFELKDQIDQGVMPEPDYIYVPTGSMGTAAGLMLGIKAAQLKTTVVAVAVEPEEKSNAFTQGIVDLFHQTNALLHSLDASFPIFECTEKDVCVAHNFCGLEYGLFTPEGIDAIKLLNKTEGIILDGTYSSKALAALIHDVRNHHIDSNETVLFWNTYCSQDFSDIVSHIDYTELPYCFHSYFEHGVQLLDT